MSRSTLERLPYELSTDYEKLWDLMQRGHILFTIVAPFNNDIGQESRHREFGHAEVTDRGIRLGNCVYTYSNPKNLKAATIDKCKQLELHYMPPTKATP